ncbi:MAG: ATP-grasp domain-containing protein [Myxococcota bacterium]
MAAPPTDPERPLRVGVTGLNATDNPGPGVAVVRSLRHALGRDVHVVGLAYDSLEPGVYARGLVDDAFLVPYPSEGADALRARLDDIREEVGLDVIVPTLDAELPSFISLEPWLAEQGIGTFLPTAEQYELRSKAHLAALGRASGIPVPETRMVGSVDALYDLHEEIPYPFVVKGAYYGATVAHDLDEAVRAWHGTVARWGLPVIVQAFLRGDELNVVAVGDGRGGLVGAVPMRKTWITDKGKGWAGVTVRDPELERLTRRFMGVSRWRGPCEVEVVRDEDGGHHLLEVNPRFPAWCYLSAGAGLNLPHAVVRLARGEEVDPGGDYRVGTMFVRISVDQIVPIEDFQRITTTGHLAHAPDAAPEAPAGDPTHPPEPGRRS